MNTLKFGAKVVIILVALMVLLCCGLTTLLTYQWLSPAARSVTEKVVTVPIAQDKEEVSKPSSNEEQASSVSGSTEDSERVCKFIDGYDTNGKVVPAGTNVKGPAFVKPDRNVDWGLPVYVGESYTTKASDEVVWLLDGDNACVDSQSAFFSFWGKTLTK